MLINSPKSKIQGFISRAIRDARKPPPKVIDSTINFLARHWWLSLLVFVAIIYCSFLGLRPLRFEEGRRAVQAIAILDGQSLWLLETLGQPYVNKPPLLPWLMALFGTALGSLNELAVRAPPVTAVLVGAFSAAAMARKLVKTDLRNLAALGAGLAYLTSPYMLLKGRVGETDTLVTALAGVAFLIWSSARLENRLRPVHWIAITACLAGILFTKGPIPTAFVLAPILVTAALDRNWRECGMAIGATIFAAIPLITWIAINLAVTNPMVWAREMRVAGRHWDLDYLLFLLRLGEIPAGVASVLPWAIVAGVYMLHRRSQPRREDDWLYRALLLYAVPVAIVVLLWPSAHGRYAMPASWPVAVLAGIAIASWRRYRIISSVIAATVIGAILLQLGTIISIKVIPKYKRQRIAANALHATMNNIPPGPVLLIWTKDAKANFNLLAYADRRLIRIDADTSDCADGGNYLLVRDDMISFVANSKIWNRVDDNEQSGLALFERAGPARPNADGCRSIL